MTRLQSQYNNLQEDFISMSKSLAESLKLLAGSFVPILESKEREN
jgi:hypothetical protein